MKLSCNKRELVEALQIVSKAVAAKPQTPIMSGIYLRAENNTLELQANNYELGLVAKIPAQVEEPGQLVATGRYLQEVVRRLPGETVAFAYRKEENIVQIQSDTSNFTLLSMNASEFPTIRYLEDQLSFTIKDNVLRKLIKKTVFSCATDESRPIFTGCYMDINDTLITMAATNTHRLSVKTAIFDENIGNIRIIIPSRVLNELMHIINSDIPTDVRVTCSHNQISFECDNIYITSRLIEGQFPDYQNIIPKSFATEARMNTSELIAAVDRVALISRANDYNIIRFEFSGQKLHISSNNPEIGNAEDTVAAEITGPDVNIAFNAQYIVDVLKNLDEEECRVELNQPLQPAAIHEGSDSTFIYVVTPVRTAN